MEYLKAPIGDDQFVDAWLHKKLQNLQKIVNIVSAMPYKHEAATLLKSTSAVCGVVYLMRILPPDQISSFMLDFDALVRSGFEQILGIPMNDLWWEIAKLPPKYGGMGWKTGSHTFGAQYISSLAKTADSVHRITPHHNAQHAAQREAGSWLTNIAPPGITVKSIMTAIQNPQRQQRSPDLSAINLSTAQLCDKWHWKKLVPQLSEQEMNHTLAHSGSTNWWVSCVPLAHKRWNMTPKKWTAAVRKRLFLDVIPAEQQCPYCHWQRCDTKGNHAVMCMTYMAAQLDKKPAGKSH